MSESANTQTIRDLYAAFARGDIAHIVSQLTDDVRWKTHFEAVVPWSADYTGKRQVPQFFDAIFTAGEVLAFEPQDWVAQGDTVVSVGTFAYRARGCGQTAHTRWVFIWKFRDGKVCSYEQFHDPAIAAIFR